jgi:hypothetical protein
MLKLRAQKKTFELFIRNTGKQLKELRMVTSIKNTDRDYWGFFFYNKPYKVEFFHHKNYLIGTNIKCF